MRVGLLVPSLALACSLADPLAAGEPAGSVPQWQQERQLAYLRFACARPLDPTQQSQVLIHLTCERRLDGFALAPGSVPDDAWDDRFARMLRLQDMSDLNALRFLSLVYAHSGHPALSPELWQRVDEALLSFKYWSSDPTPERVFDGAPVTDSMWYWSENHSLIFRTAEYLAGQRYAEETFAVTGLTGEEHRERARPQLLAWLDHRARWGFTEWHSDVYYALDLEPLLMLVEWAEDEEVSTRAAMLLDLLWLDVALHLHHGNSGGTHGRSYIKDKAAAELNDTFDGSKLLFDDTRTDWADPASQLAGLLSLSTAYALPWVIREIARDDAPMVDRERMNLPVDEHPPSAWDTPAPPPPYELTYTEADLPLWWSMNAFAAWPLLPLTFAVAGRDGLWDSQLADLAVLAELVDATKGPAGIMEDLHLLYRSLWTSLNARLLEEVHTTTYRTGATMLSSAQDYRKGSIGRQIHSWQATLDERAIVFTQQPRRLPLATGEPITPEFDWRAFDEPGPGYWTGEASLPRTGQIDNVAIVLYAPQYTPAPLFADYGYRDETHAYFPVAHFDEVVQHDGWTFGRRGDGYVALYSHNPTSWRLDRPAVYRNDGLPFDLVAAGDQNAWIVEVGDAAAWQDFATFRAAIAAAELSVVPVADRDGDGHGDAFDVTYASPSRGTITFGWHAPLTVDGAEVPLRHQQRIDNPFVRAPFDGRRYEIARGGDRLRLDFTTGERSATPPPAGR
ncbi:hypothetical protein [Nannocystis sp. SCPEA4]|uniref:hypothetical protein n=1 Tax=Nannocystis sp. SCPEA4 TaxID=2996787 RepID=UPI00226E8602|nr:hypothetical protein [Nannocystis sp. SCPEA4]MCY1060088.1 hypothetical protein [Nannocystis sp. SCPEA4]